jgi:hypothetical protein
MLADDHFERVRRLDLGTGRLHAVGLGEVLRLLDDLAGAVIDIDRRFGLCSLDQRVEIEVLGKHRRCRRKAGDGRRGKQGR